MRLTVQQAQFFRHTGYIKVEEKVPAEMVTRLRAAILRNVSEQIKPYTRDARGRIVRISNLTAREPIFLELMRSPQVLDPLESLLGPNIELRRNRHNHATLTLSDSSAPRLHRDVLQWSRSLVSVIVYLEETTVGNGCTHLIPGSHLLPFVGTPNNGGTWMDEHGMFADLLSQAVPVPMPEGGILIFDGLAFHSVGVNREGGTRMAITAGYHSTDELGPADANCLLVRGERIYKGNDAYY